MSHYVDVKTMITDAQALVRALGRLGFAVVENHEQAKNMNGYFGSQVSQKANVIVRRQYVGHADMGFLKTSDGTFTCQMDSYDKEKSHGGKYGPEWQQKLTVWYGVEKAKMELDRKGMKYKEDMDEQERPRIRVKL